MENVPLDQHTVQKYQSMIDATREDLQLMHGNFNDDLFNEVATVYVEALDKEGFIYDFDDTWQWAGYSRKSDAKRLLLGTRGSLGLRENRDFKIVLRQLAENSIRGGNGEGRPSEKILLTPNGFNQFVLGAQTPAGYFLRDLVFALIRNFKKFVDAVNSGEIEVKRRSSEGDTRESKRVKAADAQSVLTASIKELNPCDGSIYGVVSGDTNKAVMGMYKYELARVLGLRPRQVNARDYMTPQQLSFADSVMLLSADEILNGDGHSDPVTIHRRNCQKLAEAFGDQIHGKIAENKCTAKDARKAESTQPLSIHECPPGHTIKRVKTITITDYFQKKVDSDAS